jgi:hypothetical protein
MEQSGGYRVSPETFLGLSRVGLASPTHPLPAVSYRFHEYRAALIPTGPMTAPWAMVASLPVAREGLWKTEVVFGHDDL